MLRRWAVGVLLALLVPAGMVAPVGPAQGAERTVAVALFFSPGSLQTLSGLTPQDYASSALSSGLAAAASGRFKVTPRPEVRAAEQRLGWHEQDALRFAKLAELGRTVGADVVVVGWVRTLDIGTTGGGKTGTSGGDGARGLMVGLAQCVLQVFDVRQGRLVYETTASGHAAGGTAVGVAERSLNDAIAQGVPALIPVIAAGAGAM